MNHGNVSPEIAQELLELKQRITATNIPPSKIDESVNIATWNLREFRRKNRTEAVIHFITKILGHFDVIGIVKLRDDLTDLGRVLEVLGHTWRAVDSNMLPDAGGHHKRSTFAFDQRDVVFNGLVP